MASTTYISQGWSAQSSSSSPWNAGILLDIPTIINQYPPGLGYGAWRSSSKSTPMSYDHGIATGSKRSRPPLIRSNRRAPPPPTPSRVQPVPMAFPEDPFADSHALDDENTAVSNIVIYKSPPHQSRIRVAPQTSTVPSHSYPMHSFQVADKLARQRAAADKEARLKVIASILLNRVNVVGKPMRRRPRNVAADGQRAYVRSGLGRCISVAE